MNKLMEFIVRMKDEASAKFAALRGGIRQTGEEAKKTNPALGETGTRIAEATGKFAQAREAMMKVVGVGGMMVGVFMAAYRTALPLGEYIRRMWDPVEKAAHDFKRMEKVLQDSAAQTQKTLDAHVKEVGKLESAWERSVGSVRRFFEVYGKLKDAKKTNLTPEEAQAGLKEAEAAKVQHGKFAIDISSQIYVKETERKENAKKYPAQKTPEELQKFLISDGILKSEIGLLKEKLAVAKENIDRSTEDIKVAQETIKYAKINTAKEVADKESEAMKKRVAEERQLRIYALKDAAEVERASADAMGARLEKAKEAARQAWDEYKDPEKRASRVAAEEQEAGFESAYAKQAKELQKRIDQAATYGGRMDMSESEKAVKAVMDARAKEAVAEASLKQIEANTKGLADKLETLLRLK